MVAPSPASVAAATDGGAGRWSTGERRAVLLAAAVGAFLCLLLPVFAQESYYWDYGQHPALSYLDHPPMVGWLSWLGGACFGDGVVGVRAATWLAGLGATLAGMALLGAFDVDARGRVAWVVLGLGAPALLATRFLANPDPPLVLFWTLCLLALWRARDGGLGWWLLAGVAAGAALLSKYTAAFLAVGGVLVLLLDPAMRRQLLRPGPWLALAAAGAAFAPVVIWNAQHHYESFRFQAEHRYREAGFAWRNALESLGVQVGVLNPAVAALLPLALLWLLRQARRRDTRALWCLCFGLPLPLYMLGNSPWIDIKANWLVPALVPLLIGGVLWWRESGWAERHPRWRTTVRWSLLAVLLLLPLAPLIRWVPQTRGTSWTGWDEIAVRVHHWCGRLDVADAGPGGVFAFASGYRDTAQLARNLELLRAAAGEPAAVPVLSQAVFGDFAQQYSLWDEPWSHVGDDAIFVLSRPDRRPDDIAKLRARFATCERVERVTVTRLGRLVLEVDLWACRDYRGPVPK